MKAITAKRVLIIVIAMFSMSAMLGCTRILGISKSTRSGEYYPTPLVEADRALDEARFAGKDKECPDEFNAFKDRVDDAYKVHLSCRTEEAISMARRVMDEIKAPCPPRPVVKKPAPPPPPAPKLEKVCIVLKIEFDTGKADIKPYYHVEIGRVAEFMKKYPSAKGVIEGHTDNVGGYDYNMKLSERRAANVRKYLVETYGIAPDRLSSRGYGFTKPVASNSTREGRQKNRRIEANFDCVIVTK